MYKTYIRLYIIANKKTNLLMLDMFYSTIFTQMWYNMFL